MKQDNNRKKMQEEKDESKKEQKNDPNKHHKMMIRDFRKRFIVSIILTIPVLVFSPLIQDILGYNISFDGIQYIMFGFSSIIYLYGGWPFLSGFKKEIKEKNPGMMTLIAVAISVAYIYSLSVVFGLEGRYFFWELATLIDVMLIGHWIEMKSVLGASRALEELIKIMPSEAHLLKDGKTIDVSVDELQRKDILLIKPGEKVPIDGIIIDGDSSFDESLITGESKLVSKSKGDNVIGGAINKEGSLKMEVSKVGKDTYLNQVVDMVQNAQNTKSKTQNLVDRAALILTIIAISIGIITFVVWLILGEDLAFALERTATVMVTTCPHALGLAIPLVIAQSTTYGATSGLLIRNRTEFEIARKITAIIFDKTGTLTKGEFGVTDIITFSDLPENEILSISASLEQKSEHPIAQGVLNSANEKSLDLEKVYDFKAIPGKGIEGKINDEKYTLVSQNYVKEMEISFNSAQVKKIKKQGKTIIFLLQEKKILGVMGLADVIRKESKDAKSKLKQMGIHTIMLTGDNKYVAKWVADEIGIDEVFAEVLPDGKVAKVKEIKEKYTVAMVGDGINDAPALATADVGIAIGTGTDVAVETADIILVRSNPQDVVDILTLSQNTYKKMVQNLFWATGYNLIAIPLAAGVLSGIGILLSPAIGALIMSLSTIIVALNAKLLKKP